MSRSFVKEDDLEHSSINLPERAISPHTNYVTRAGYQALQTQLNSFKIEKNQLKQLDSANHQQRIAVIERDLRYLNARLKSAQISQPEHAQLVFFGSTVTIEDENGTMQTYQIVGEDEADIKANKISWISPLARGLLGKQVGDTFALQRPVGKIELSVLKITI